MMSNRTRSLQIVALPKLACAPVTLRGGGSGADAVVVINGEAAIGMVSRAFSTKQQSRLKHEVIGYDALAIVVNQANPLSGLSKAQVILMRGPAGVAALQRQGFQPPHGQSDTQQ